MTTGRGRQVHLGWVLCLAIGVLPRSLNGQGAGELISPCLGSSGTALIWCQEAALAAQAAKGALGLAASGATDLPGSASTLGWRMKGAPRYALSLRGSFTRAPSPSLRGNGSLPQGETTLNIPSVHVSGTVGLFDGFSLGPTVGGFASVDLTASAQWIAPPTDRGFDGNVTGWGLGTRIGILRESFTLPGLSFSAFHRALGSVRLWEVTSGNPAEASFDLRVLSLRGVLGKDLWGVGLLGGAGWDRYGGDLTLVLEDTGAGSPPTSGEGELRTERWLFFIGGSMTFLALQLSAEVGWAEGFSPSMPASSAGGFDPSSGSQFGALALRLTF